MALAINIVLGANTVQFNKNIHKATADAKKELKGLSGFTQKVFDNLTFGNIIGVGALNTIVQTADRMQDLASKVRINTQSIDEYNAVLQDLRKISTDYWTAIDGITDLYASSKRALDSLGASQRQVLDFTRNITMAMSIGGGSAAAQEAALTQLGQAMSTGALRGEEFNSVSEQAPVIIDLLTDSLKVSRGELRSMAAEGKITSQVMMDSVLGGYDKLKATIDKMPTTFAQGVQNIKSEYDFLVDDVMNQNTLLSQHLANSALWVANHFRELVTVGTLVGAVSIANIAKNSELASSFMGLTGATLAKTKSSIADAFSIQGQINAYNALSTRMMLLRLTKAHYIDLTKTAIATTTAYARSLVGLTSSFNTATASARLHTLALAGVTTAKRTAMGVGILATRAVTGLGGAFMSLGRVIAAHPIISLTTVIGAVIARTDGLNGAIKSLGDAFSVAGVLASDFIGGVVDGLGMAWTATANYFDKFIGGSANATSFAQTAFGGFFAGTHKGFVGVLQTIARVFDLAGASVVTFAKYAYKNISSLGTAIANVFKGVGNFIAFVFEGTINNAVDKINFAIDSMNAISGVFGGGTIARLGQVSIGRLQYGSTDFGFGGFSASVAQNNVHYLENQVVGAYDKVQNSAKQANTANLGLAGSMANVANASEKAGSGAKKAANANKLLGKSAEEASKALKELEDSYNNQLAQWQKGLWELKSPIATETHQMQFELKFGKFQGLQDDLKEKLLYHAGVFDQFKIQADIDKLINEYNQTNVLLDYHNNEIAKLVLSFNDKYSDLSLASEEFKQRLLRSVTDLEINKIAFDLADQNKEIRYQIELLSQKSDIDRSILEINQWQNKELAAYDKLLLEGVLLQSDYNALKERFDTTSNLKKQLAIQISYNALIDDLKTEEQKRLNTLGSQLDILKAQSAITGGMFDFDKAKQLISTNIGLTAPKTAYDDLNSQNEHRLNTLDSSLQNLLNNDRLTEQERINIKQWGADERLKIEQAHTQAMNALVLSDSQNMFGSLASIAKDGLGEQSRLYRAMFAMQQGFAIAQAGIAMQQAFSQGLAKGFPLGLADMALAAAEGAKIISAIKSVVMPVGQAHDGIMSVPKSGTWNLEKGERVLPKHTAQNLDNTLNRLQNNGGGQIINVNVTVNANNGDVESSHNLGKNLGNAIKSAVQAELQKERRQGGMLYGR